ncbi:hypothetical protein TL16_g10795 [Triparma laevis f. inornata]|nr:hypothetical protein TL16_g10795 [Triparma laevis f. inornata]
MAASSINVTGSAVLDKSLTTLHTVSIQVPTPGSLNEEGEYVIHTSNATSLMADTLKNASIPKKTVDTHEWTASLCKKMNVLPSGSTSKKRGRANSDDEIQMEEADKSKALKCTLTSNFFVNPMKNKLCGHVVDKSGVAQMMKAKKEQSCPLGVSCAKGKKQKCSWDLYEEDEEMRLKVESYRRREKKREEKRRREDDDDAIDVDEEEGGEGGEEDVEVL